MQNKESFIRNRIKSIGYALKGMCILIRTENSIKVQCALSIIIILAGIYFQISKVEWMLQTFVIGLVLVTETLNTAIERIANFVHPKKHAKIAEIKDIAAGAVAMAWLTNLIVLSTVYVPKIFCW